MGLSMAPGGDPRLTEDQNLRYLQADLQAAREMGDQRLIADLERRIADILSQGEGDPFGYEDFTPEEFPTIGAYDVGSWLHSVPEKVGDKGQEIGDAFTDFNTKRAKEIEDELATQKMNPFQLGLHGYGPDEDLLLSGYPEMQGPPMPPLPEPLLSEPEDPWSFDPATDMPPGGDQNFPGDWTFDPTTDMPPGSTEFTPAFTGSDFGEPQLSTHGTDRLVTELQQGDVDSGGEAIRGHKVFPETRKKVLDWLGHDEESSGHLGHALMQAGGAILSGGPIWQKALGHGITRGTEAYQEHKEAGLEEEATRQRMALAQSEMEMKRRNYADSQADRQDRLRRERLQDQKTEADMFLEGYRMKDGKLQWDEKWVKNKPSYSEKLTDKQREWDFYDNPDNFRSKESRDSYYETVLKGNKAEDIYGG